LRCLLSHTNFTVKLNAFCGSFKRGGLVESWRICAYEAYKSLKTINKSKISIYHLIVNPVSKISTLLINLTNCLPLVSSNRTCARYFWLNGFQVTEIYTSYAVNNVLNIFKQIRTKTLLVIKKY
jgi:hypothetical protein